MVLEWSREAELGEGEAASILLLDVSINIILFISYYFNFTLPLFLEEIYRVPDDDLAYTTFILVNDLLLLFYSHFTTIYMYVLLMMLLFYIGRT